MIRKFVNLFSCCCVIVGMGLSAVSVQADMDTETRLQLLSEALSARNAGDLERSREILVQLAEAAPEDQAVQRLLQNVEENLRVAREREATRARTPRRVAEVDEEPDTLLAIEQARLRDAREEASAFQQIAERRIRDGDYEEALEALSRAKEVLPVAPPTERQIEEIDNRATEVFLLIAQQRLEEGDLAGARQALSAAADTGLETRQAQRMAERVEREIDHPRNIPIEEVSPQYVDQQRRVRELSRIGRAQYINGDLVGAEQSFREVEAIQSDNAEAKVFLRRIAETRLRRDGLDRVKTRTQMLESVSTAWQRPAVFVDRPHVDVDDIEEPELMQRMREIRIPSVNFAGVELSRAINTLSAISEEYDPEGEGVNIVPMLGDEDPLVHINVRDLSLLRVLDLIVDSVRHRYDVEEDVVIVRRGVRADPRLETENIPVSEATINRLVGRTAPTNGQPEVDDPFAPPAEPTEPAPPTNGGREDDLRRFLERAANVDFTVAGSNIIYDGTDLWITHTPRNIERVRNVFRRMTDVRQVEIEAKFLEVSQGSVDELGFNWQMISPGGSVRMQTANRELAGAFAGQQAGREIRIVTQQDEFRFPMTPPTLPGVVGMGAGAPNLAFIDGSVDGYDVDAVIRALNQRTGTDLLSAPKVTVLSGREANIVVAQEIRYPDSYGDTQSEVGRGGVGDAGAAGVTITPGTPQDFQTRPVGVELRVTPTVEQDNSVTMDLSPRVTEFDGFVEYGGLSVAISAGQIVTNPSGFYQPIFSTREINTQVNVWDGATVVLGGLTREEVRRVSDKTPVLGDLPVLGRFFRSQGEASEKRNLLIFVTANLVSPGGSPMRQQLRTVEPGAMFQNPTVVTPAGNVPREKVEQ